MTVKHSFAAQVGLADFVGASTPAVVPDASTVAFDLNVSVGDDWCLRDLDVHVRLHHPCTRELTIELLGPGPNVGDDNFGAPVANSWPVVLLAPETTSTSCVTLDPPVSTQDAIRDFAYPGDPGLYFDDDADVDVRAPGMNGYGGHFRPVDALAEFDGIKPSGTWTLRITDHGGARRVREFARANLTAWRLVARLERCERTYVWTNVTNATGTAPPALAGALGVTTGESLFVYGGRTAWDPWPTPRLFRYDAPVNHWTELNAAPVDTAAYAPLGKAAVMTPYGIYAFGGLGFRFDAKGFAISQFDPTVHWFDMVSNRWWRDTHVSPYKHATAVFPGQHRVDAETVVAAKRDSVDLHPAPRGRYYASLAYLEQGIADHLSSAAKVRAGTLPNTDAALPPALFLFGGDDDQSDLDDAWLLKLANASLRHVDNPDFELHLSPSFHPGYCDFRFKGQSRRDWEASCGASTYPDHDWDASSTPYPNECELNDFLTRAYCEHQYQSLNHFPG